MAKQKIYDSLNSSYEVEVEEQGDGSKRQVVKVAEMPAISVPLDPAAATAAKQDTGNASLASIDAKLDAITTPADTQPVSIASLPLAVDAATETTLSSIDTKLDSLTTPSDTQPVSIAALPLPSGAATESTLSTLNGKVTACNTGAVVVPSSAILAKAVDCSASGDNTVHTPAAGKSIRAQYLSLSANGANTADVTAVVKFAAGGSTLYKLSLKAGAIWARNIGAGKFYLDGGANNALIVNLSTAQTVHVSLEYGEV